MFSSLIPPNTLNFFRLHTCVFSYFPKVMLCTMAGRSSFRVRYCQNNTDELLEPQEQEQTSQVQSTPLSTTRAQPRLAFQRAKGGKVFFLNGTEQDLLQNLSFSYDVWDRKKLLGVDNFIKSQISSQEPNAIMFLWMNILLFWVQMWCQGFLSGFLFALN